MHTTPTDRGTSRHRQIAHEEAARAFGTLAETTLGLLAPTAGLYTRAEWLYRAHCRELCQRALAGEDLAAPTVAELAAQLFSLATTHAATWTQGDEAALCSAVLQAGTWAGERERAQALLRGRIPQEPYRGAIDAVWAELAPELAQPWRRVAPAQGAA